MERQLFLAVNCKDKKIIAIFSNPTDCYKFVHGRTESGNKLDDDNLATQFHPWHGLKEEEPHLGDVFIDVRYGDVEENV